MAGKAVAAGAGHAAGAEGLQGHHPRMARESDSSRADVSAAAVAAAQQHHHMVVTAGGAMAAPAHELGMV
jgi:hypothetical protein